MVVIKALRPAIWCSSSGFDGGRLVPADEVRFVQFPLPALSLSLRLSSGNNAKLRLVQATEESSMPITNDHAASISGENLHQIATNGKATNIVWHKSPIGKLNRQELLQQKGCVIWITGLSGSGKSTLACALCHALYAKGKLAYILDGDNVRHGLNCDLSFKAEDRAENIRRIGEVAKLFADAGIICIASVISPYKKDRDACRALLPEGDFIEVFMNVPLQICEARDPKGLYKLARAGKIKVRIATKGKHLCFPMRNG
ncbi:adenylyl-sulfate kinase 3-like isoform X2 [Hibiscus syriacus]|uniref:adenylyl-sulfate kinase 3-like isoform X2 n=1 Tax=Hibiscus syriacus TaxID=106335 RepID=UPI00192218EA|nr:adenylyl-sulfate kinase 3-like isoform X2 [Hibiscus syriacus]